jgi:hypothetical protein
MKYAIEMGSCVMIYIPGSIKSGSGTQKVRRGTPRHRDRMVIS